SNTSQNKLRTFLLESTEHLPGVALGDFAGAVVICVVSLRAAVVAVVRPRLCPQPEDFDNPWKAAQ
ncbi:MAG: hypothetical protein RMM29_08860, partial [Planctomycetota bacterium]|nr:hypothetical protein [Planctomycetota bacterium]